MPSLLPFDNATIGLQELAPAQVVPGSGSYREYGRDLATTTADGRIHHDRQAILIRAALQLRGDWTSLDSATGLSQDIVLRRGATAIASFAGLVSAVYHDRSRTTALTIVGDPLAD